LIEFVEGRVKSPESIALKVSNKNIAIEEVKDIAGIRLVCRFLDDIDKIIETIKQYANHNYRIVCEKDYVSICKPSGYRSYHVQIEYDMLTKDGVACVPCEIQVRTLAMNSCVCSWNIKSNQI
jgi:putative GTP pyrophosphokinase